MADYGYNMDTTKSTLGHHATNLKVPFSLSIIVVIVAFAALVLAIFSFIRSYTFTRDSILDTVQGVYPGVQVASTGLPILGSNSPYTIDGYQVENGELVLLKDEVNAQDNGIYKLQNNKFVRDTSMNNYRQIVEGNNVFVQSGKINGGTSFTLLKETNAFNASNDITGEGIFFVNATSQSLALNRVNIPDGSIIVSENTKVDGFKWAKNLIEIKAENGITTASGEPITGSGTLSLTETGVVAGTYQYTNITVDAYGRISNASDGSSGVGVLSVFSRTGAVVAEANDYSASQIQNTPNGTISSITVQNAINELDTEKVSDSILTTKGDIFAKSATVITRLGAGLNGQVLIADSTESLGLKWAESLVTSVFGRTGSVTAQTADYNATQISNMASGSISATNVQAAINELDNEKVARNILTQKGSMYVASAPQVAIDLPVGIDTHVLTADSAALSGVKWASAPVLSIFGRSGTVAAVSGDYTAGQVTNVPSGTISSNNVQDALNELDTEKTAKSTLTSKGDIYVATAASTPSNLTVGINNQMLIPDSTTATGLRWRSNIVSRVALGIFPDAKTASVFTPAYQITIPANTLQNDGDILEFYFLAVEPSNNNTTVQVRIVEGVTPTNICNSTGNINDNNGTIVLHGLVTRNTVTGADVVIKLNTTADSAGAFSAIIDNQISSQSITTGLNWANLQTLEILGSTDNATIGNRAIAKYLIANISGTS